MPLKPTLIFILQLAAWTGVEPYFGAAYAQTSPAPAPGPRSRSAVSPTAAPAPTPPPADPPTTPAKPAPNTTTTTTTVTTNGPAPAAVPGAAVNYPGYPPGVYSVPAGGYLPGTYPYGTYPAPAGGYPPGTYPLGLYPAAAGGFSQGAAVPGARPNPAGTPIPSFAYPAMTPTGGLAAPALGAGAAGTMVLPPGVTAPLAMPAAPGGLAIATPQAPAPAPAPQGPPATDNPGPAPQAPPVPIHEPRYSMAFINKQADDALIRLGQAAGMTLDFLSPTTDVITLSFEQATFHQAMDLICAAADLHYREQNGAVHVGLAMDLDVKYPQKDEKNLDATYRCRHLDAIALAETLGKILPNTLRITEGPKYLSPSVDSGTDASNLGGDQAVRALNGTDSTFKIHDIVISGPADLVRRALQLARKFDRPRKQVKIDIRVAEIDDTSSQNLGVSWMSTLDLSATEQIPTSAAAAAAAAAGTVSTASSAVPGIKLGTFSHNPLTVNATINALESKGKARTLSNPTLLLMDGERSFILSGQKILYPQFTSKDSSGQSLFSVETLKVGIYLQVSAQIGLNNDVVLTLFPQVTALESFTNYNNGQYPIVSTREAQTTVRAYSGQMVALGGLRATSESDERDGIPFLKDIPILGRLFSTVNKSRNKSNLMIFLTPQIEDDLDHVDPISVTVTP